MPEVRSPGNEYDHFEKMQKLRKDTHEAMKKEISERLSANPDPTDEEIMIGAHKEMLEPQVRDILFSLHSKGYSTESSGFYGDNGEIQSIDGYFFLEDKVKQRLRAVGFKVDMGDEIKAPGGKHYTLISFRPESPDLDEIEKKWKEMLDILPDRNKEADPSISDGSQEWREEFAPARKDIRLRVLKKRLDVGDIDPEIKKQWEDEIYDLEKEIV